MPPAARAARSAAGGRERVAPDGLALTAPQPSDDLLALEDEALAQLAVLTVPQAAALGVAPRTADFLWAYAKSWLLQRIETDSPR